MSAAAEFPKMTSAELLKRLNSMRTASDLQPLEPCLQVVPSWPLTPEAKDSILREHAMQLRRAASAESSTPKERTRRYEQIEQELGAAVKLANPTLYEETWRTRERDWSELDRLRGATSPRS